LPSPVCGEEQERTFGPFRPVRLGIAPGQRSVPEHATHHSGRGRAAGAASLVAQSTDDATRHAPILSGRQWVSGHKTMSVFRRYDITSTEDLREAAARLEAPSKGVAAD
jgi:hypothetical protein